MEFKEFPKIPRLSRDIVITEKIDGTNASIYIDYINLLDETTPITATVGEFFIAAASRSRWITPSGDNYGFANWVKTNAEELIKLGPGHHFGEWWGQGIQRNYGLKEKRFSLFNVAKWAELCPSCCSVVPTIFRGSFNTNDIEIALALLKKNGSFAAPGFMNPEGIVIFHTAGNLMFKKTIEKDDQPKSKV